MDLRAETERRVAFQVGDTGSPVTEIGYRRLLVFDEYKLRWHRSMLKFCPHGLFDCEGFYIAWNLLTVRTFSKQHQEGMSMCKDVYILDDKIAQHDGFFGDFGGCFISEDLYAPIKEIEENFKRLVVDPKFQKELAYYQKNFIGRESPLYYAKNLSEHNGGAKIYFKREDLNHTGSHKINNCVGQALLAKSMGKKRIIAETGAGQHGVASATVAAHFGMSCTVYMGKKDYDRQYSNVVKMKLLGAEVIPVEIADQGLKEAVDVALKDFSDTYRDSYYIIGSSVGPHPYPLMVRTFQSVIGMEARKQILESEAKLPKAVVAAVGGGSNSIGIFHGFLEDKDVELYGIEPAGLGLDTGKHAATINKGVEGVLHSFKSIVLIDDQGEVLPVHSVAAGLDYPGVGPEHSYLYKSGAANYVAVTDEDAIEAFKLTTCKEGIIPALESSHAVAYALFLAKKLPKEDIVIACLSGQGDKDSERII